MPVESTFPETLDVLPVDVGGDTSASTGLPEPDETPSHHSENHNKANAAIMKLEEVVLELLEAGGGGGEFQPLDADLTAIAALTTTTFGRSLLTLANEAAGRTALGLGSAATHASTDFDSAGAAAAAEAASQPLDGDLTAIAALSTTSVGRSLLAIANAAAGRTILEAASTASVTAEEERAKAAESSVKGEVSTEKSRAETAEGLKASKTELATETSARESADSAKASKTELITEETRAKAAEALKASKTEVAQSRLGSLTVVSAVPTFKNSSESATEEKAGKAESHQRIENSRNHKALTSGQPLGALIEVPPNTVVSGVAFDVLLTEATAANRTHLWVAVQDSSHALKGVSADYTSSTNTPLESEKLRALKLETPFETGNEWSLLYALICEVMSSTAAVEVRGVENSSASAKTAPLLGFVGATGRTNPASLNTTATVSSFIPWLTLV